MGKAAKRKYGREATGAPAPAPARDAPNRVLFGLALIGMAIAGYLTVTAWRGQMVAGCAAGSACDAVLASQWGKLFGVPTSFWGFLAYASLAAIAFIKRADLHWKTAFIVSLFGVLFSAYLTGIALIELKAACPYCLSSFAVMTAILGVTVYQRPAGPANFSWAGWLAKTASGGLVLVIALHFYYLGAWSGATAGNGPRLDALADHLTKIDAKFYGASWCPHCKEQKRMFGAAADRLPYIECSPQGPGSRQAPICEMMHIEGYPTWIINGRQYKGALTPEDLAIASGFQNR